MLEKNVDVLIVDAGNTRIKVAAFFRNEIRELVFFKVDENAAFEQFVGKCHAPPIFVSSVLSEASTRKFLGEKYAYLLLRRNMKFGVKMNYSTPETLGLDRLANACAIQQLKPKSNKVCVDMGTCIKFDFVNDKGEYFGGSISPGLRMRYEALHQFTGKLPLLETNQKIGLIGGNSQDSIHSGVINGMKAEILGLMKSYNQHYQGLTFFMTGGDLKYFEFDSKNNIFAHENLTLFGLHDIYQQNA